jgi:hypothetical protein
VESEGVGKPLTRQIVRMISNDGPNELMIPLALDRSLISESGEFYHPIWAGSTHYRHPRARI